MCKAKELTLEDAYKTGLRVGRKLRQEHGSVEQAKTHLYQIDEKSFTDSQMCQEYYRGVRDGIGTGLTD